jgi:hypothetical protein
MVWTLGSATAMGAMATSGHPEIALAVATALGAAATRPARIYLLPIVAMFVVVAALLLSAFGVPMVVAAGALAGFAVGTGNFLTRAEAVLAGAGGAGLGLWLTSELPAPFDGAIASAMWTGAIVGLCVAQSLLPGALRWHRADRIPSPGRIQATILPMYRSSCMRAWQLDQELTAQAPDRDTRRGLQEVSAWVYRLALTLQTLDGDIARIDPDAARARRAELLATGPAGEDAFIRERRLGTVEHLNRMLEHREALVLERARAASLQDYALAYLEEARAGLAVARVQAGDHAPENLGVVLQKLRAHANERGVQRKTALELGDVGR